VNECIERKTLPEYSQPRVYLIPMMATSFESFLLWTIVQIVLHQASINITKKTPNKETDSNKFLKHSKAVIIEAW